MELSGRANQKEMNEAKEVDGFGHLTRLLVDGFFVQRRPLSLGTLADDAGANRAER